MDEPQEDSENPRVSLSDTSHWSKEEYVSNIIFDSCSPRAFKETHLFRISADLFITYGSSAEFWIEPIQTCIEDIDVLSYDRGRIAFSRDVPMLPHEVRNCNEKIECYQLEPYAKYPGFVQLKHVGDMIFEWNSHKYEFYEARYISTRCTTHIKTITMAHQCQKNVGGVCTFDEQVKGSAIFFMNRNAHRNKTLSVFCPQWPTEATDWFHRPRIYGWPTKSNLHKIANMGCHVVHVQHRDCRDDEYQWRLFFSVAEVVLLRSCTKTQQLVYHMLRFFAKKKLIQEVCSKEKGILCSYHLKTLMLWTCEQESPEWWNSSLILTCSKLLRKLSEWLQRRHCPNYFIPEENLFYEQIDLDIYEGIAEDIRSLSNTKNLSQWFVGNYLLPCCTEKDWTAYNTDEDSLTEFCIRASTITFQNKYEILGAFDKFFCENAITDSDLLEEELIWREVEKCTDEWKQHSHVPRCLSVTSEKSSVYMKSLSYMLRAANAIACKRVSCYKTFLSDIIIILLREFPSFWPKCNDFPNNYETRFDKTFVYFLRAQEYMGEITQSASDPEFQLLSRLAVESLKNSLTCNEATSKDIRCAALAYMAAICYATSQHRTVIKLCSAILSDPEPVGSSRLSSTKREPMSAVCLKFNDDVSNLIGYLLLCKHVLDASPDRYSETNLDLRLTPEVFAQYIMIQSMQRTSQQLHLNWNKIPEEFVMDAFLLTVTKKKFRDISIQAKSCMQKCRLWVYRESRSVNELINHVSGFLLNEDMCIRLLMECSLKKMASLYEDAFRDFCLQCNTLAFCYRMVYRYRCGHYDEVMTLCDQILHEPDIGANLEKYPFLNVVVLPPFSTFFDEEIQCLIGLQMLFHAVFPRRVVENSWDGIRVEPRQSCDFTWSVLQSQYLLGRHFLGRYLKLRCLIDSNNSVSEIQIAFEKLICRLPFEYTVLEFLRQKLQKLCV